MKNNNNNFNKGQHIGQLVDNGATEKSKQPNANPNTKNTANAKPNNANKQSNLPKANKPQNKELQAKTGVKQPNQNQVGAKQPQNKQNNQATSKQSNKNNNKPQKKNNAKKNLKVMFLGGIDEIGKNMTVFEYNDSIVIIDAGMSFPNSNMPGVDVVIPDMTYLKENRNKIKGLVITHGHEDHIGGVPFAIKALGGKLDIYGTKLTLGLIEDKLKEHNLLTQAKFVPVGDRSVITLGDFTAEFMHVAHSVAGAVAVCLRSPAGAVLHTGDFKIDYTPLGNDIMNLNRFAEIGQSGVLLLMSDSTNAEKPGYTLSESIVKTTMNKLFTEAKGRRIIIATFASNIDRLGMIMELAKLYKRKIAVSGRSMVNRIETAGRVGYIKLDKSLFVDIDKINNVDDGKLVILSTGSQGEPMSALTRMASGEFNKVKIGENDTIILSSSPIPGNEKDVSNVINNLYRLGARVVYSSLADVHVSGHACQEELKLIYSLVKPKYFIPVHGEYRHLKQHAMLVENLGHKPQNIIIPEIGDCVEVGVNTFKIAGSVASGNIMVDGLGVGDVGNFVLKDRLTLAEDGILVVVVGIDRNQGKVVSGPEIISRGCFFSGDGHTDEILKEITARAKDELARMEIKDCTVDTLKNNLQRGIRQYFRTKLKRNPVVLPIVVEV